MSPLKPKKIPPTDTKVCVVDATRVLRLIPITTIQPPTLMKSAEAVKTYLENLTENTLHVVLDDYSPRHGNILKKSRPGSITEREISDLSLQLPKNDEWQNFISSHNNKFQLTKLISDYLLEKTSFSQGLYVTEGQLSVIKKKLHATITSLEALFSNHREADHKIPYHVLFTISPESSVCVSSDDTDIYILMLYIAKHCDGNVYFRQRTHSSKEVIMYHHIKQLAAQLSDEICNILAVFHVLTGCDYYNPFYRRSKIQSFKKMCLKPELTTLSQSLKTPNHNLTRFKQIFNLYNT